MTPRTVKIQITATFVAEPLEVPLSFLSEKLELGLDIHFSAFNQVFQEALNPSSESVRNDSGINLFLVRPGDLSEGSLSEALVEEFSDALKNLAAKSGARNVVLFCPEEEADEERENRLISALDGVVGIDVIRSADICARYPVAEPYDRASEASGSIPYTLPMFAALALTVLRRISRYLMRPAKLIVLDADNTLWGGVVGEDGAENLSLEGAWKEFGEFLVRKHDEGFLLALCSKNSEADVDAVFKVRSSDLAFERKHFVARKANWNPKSQNIYELARELNIGLDSFVFLDDNPAEVAEVSANCSAVKAICLPEKSEDRLSFVENLWCLDSFGATSEDRSRTAFYQGESMRRQVREEAKTFESFLHGLELQVDVAPAAREDLERVSQLCQRTNQFNANTLRLTTGELTSRMDSGMDCLTVRVSDKFGDYGLVGVILYRIEKEELSAELFLLSCRALGKGVERRMVIELAKRAAAAGASELRFAFARADRNEPVVRFFEEIGASVGSEGSAYHLAVSLAAALSPLPVGKLQKLEGQPGNVPAGERDDLWNAETFTRIATEWSVPEKLAETLQSRRDPRPEIPQALVRPGSRVQKEIAGIWSDVLGLEEVGIEDSFTDLGGTSVQLVSVHVRLQKELGADLEISELFALPTISAIVKRLSEGREKGTSVSAVPRESLSRSSEDGVAIVGMSLKVPGADTPDEFWENLAAGTESVSRFSRDELENPEDCDKPGFVPAKGLIKGIEEFDASFFGILPKDAKIMDPQQRLFLELAWEAMERSGYDPDRHSERIGVFAGAYFDSYLLANLCSDPAFLAELVPQIQVGSLDTELGNDKDYLATRVAFKLNLRGPAITLQTACSTSMVAIAEACRNIRDGICDMALAGGVTITLPSKRGYFYTEQGMLSGDGHCRAFDEQASGTVFGNGAGVVMLKRLSDAIRDRDNIHAVIRGYGMNNDGGVKHSYTAPSVEGQVAAIRMAHRDAGIDPRTVTAIEAHGTGTPLGDPIEIDALTRAFREGGVTDTGFCAVGSLKTSVGHLDVASGVCGIIKTSLALEKEAIPPLLHFQKANPKIDFANSPFFPNKELRRWARGEENADPRRAGVSAFGVGGTNVHMILEEAPEVTSTPSNRDAQLFLLSARTDAALNQAAENLASFAGRAGETVDPADAAWTLSIGRKQFRNRRAIVASGWSELQEKLGKASAIGVADRSNPPVNFLFPGQGSQHINMAGTFYHSEPRFRKLVDQCSEMLRPHLGLELTSILFPGEGTNPEAAAETLKNTTLAQPAIFVIEYALADLWRHWGVEPAAMIGHSVGEFVAACHAGVFQLEDGLKLLSDRGRLMGDLPGGGMLSVRLSEADLISRMPDTLDLAAVNGPELCVVAGPYDELDAFCKKLEADDVVAKPLHTSHAFHSRMMDSVVGRFAECFQGIELKAPEIPILSTVTGKWLTVAETADPHYWARHLRETVRFSEAVAKRSEEEDSQIFVEVGPGQTLTGLARQIIGRGTQHVMISTCLHVQETGSDQAQMLDSLGRLWMNGVEVHWETFYADETRKRVPLPTYPFERKRHWVDPVPVQGRQILAGDDTAPAAASLPGAEAVIPAAIPAQNTTDAMSSNQTSRREAIAAEIRETLTDLSGIPVEELAGDATFLELGFDSLLLTQVSKAFQDRLGVPIKMRQLMSDLPTIDSLVEHLDNTLEPDRFREALVSPPAAPQAMEPSAAVVPMAMPSAPATIPMAPVPASPTIPIAGNGTVEAVIAQQMELMRQQLALLQGGTVAQVTPPAVPAAPVQAAQPAATSPPPAAVKSAENTGKDVSAPSTTISRDSDDALTSTQKAHIDSLVARYIAKTKTSKELTAEYRQWYADPRTVSGFNRLWKEMIYQIVVKKSKGSRLLDIDGNEYIDILNGFGPGFLGHSPDRITEVLHAQLDLGIEVGPQCQLAMEAAKLFCDVTGNERASFVNTGSEAVQGAMRLSRTVTGRDKIVVFAKDYHGNFDEVLVRGVGTGEKLRSIPVAPGIPNRAVDDIIVLPYGTEESLEVIRKRAHELAAVIVEPIQSRRPEFQPKEFIQEVREITRQSGTAFVFDEVITGFRTGPRGAQEFYGVEADIATYGKVVGAGMPIGVVAGKAEFMDTFDGGQWQYGDDSFPEKDVTFFAGTFVRHPLAMAAVREMLLFLKGCGPELWSDLRARANRLAGTVDRMFVENDAPFRMPNFGSQMFVRLIDDNKYANLLFFHLREKGVFLLEGFPSYLTIAHTDADVDYVIDAFTESVVEMQEGGFFPQPANGKKAGVRSRRLSGPARQLTLEEAAVSPGTESGKEVAEDGKKSEPYSPVYPLTEPLTEVWLASRVGTDSPLCFNEIVKVTLRGKLDEEALQGALKDVVERHDGLRAVFLEDGEGFRIQTHMEIPLEITDLRELNRNERESKAEDALNQVRNSPFDLVRGPLFRAHLLKLDDETSSLILVGHHLALDGWSYNVVMEDISRFYSARVKGEVLSLGTAPRLGEFALAAVEREKNNGDNADFWVSRFFETVPPLVLPRDGNATPGQLSKKSGRIYGRIDGGMLRDLKRTAGQSGATLFGMLIGTYQILLAKLARQSRLMTVFPVAGQNDGRHEELVGHCVNFLPFVGEIDEAATFSDFLKITQGNLLDAFEHQDFTYGTLLKHLPSDQRLCVEAVFNLERMDEYGEFAGLETEIEDINQGHANNPLFLNALESEGHLDFHLTYQSDLFSRETIESWLETYVAMLEKVLRNPDTTVGEISVAVSARQEEMLRSWNDTGTEYPRNCSVGELFDEIAAAYANDVAIRFSGGSVSYAELKETADRIGRCLLSKGVKPGDRVGMFLERTPDRIATLLAILRIGCAYVPLDPEYPASRLEMMVEDSGVSAVIAEAATRSMLPEFEGMVIEVKEALAANASLAEEITMPVIESDAPACVMYTSGSTGTPKGSVLPHRGIVRLVRNSNYCDLGPDETTLQAASVCFDASLLEIFGALLNGGTVALPSPGPLTIDGIAGNLKEFEVSTLWLTSGLFQLMVEEIPEAFSGLRQLLTGGDVVPVTHTRRVLEVNPGLRLINGYGPTESTTFICCHTISAKDLCGTSLPVGKPISNSTVWILDKSGALLPPGVPGELCCGGDGLALEYLNNPELTDEKFVTLEIAGRQERVYRTGDLCRYLPDGTVDFMGRIDRQVKIRGYRVEPGEIEAVLSTNPLVGQCKVVTRGEGAGERMLVAYVSPMNGKRPDPETLHDYMNAALPNYMIPSACVVMDELPVTANGKIDTRALPEPEEIRSSDTESGPANAVEERLAEMWKEVLRVSRLGMEEDFFALGGHSLLGMKLFARIQKEFDLTLPLALLFRASTVRKLSREIQRRKQAPASNGGNGFERTPVIETNGSDLVGDSSSAIAETTVLLQSEGEEPPLFGVHGGDGGVFFYRNLARHLTKDRPFYAFEAAVLTEGGMIREEPVEETAARYVAELLKVQPEGSYYLCGYSFGGVVAYEMACQLAALGKEIAFLGLIDTENPAGEMRQLSISERIAANWNSPHNQRFGVISKAMKLGRRIGTGLGYKLRFSAEGAVAKALPTAKNTGWLRQVQVRENYAAAMDEYVPRPFPGDMTLFRAMEGNDKFDLGEDYRWDLVVEGEIHKFDVPGNHISLFHKDHIAGMADALQKALPIETR